MLGKIRRNRFADRFGSDDPMPEAPRADSELRAGWEYTARPAAPPPPRDSDSTPLRASLLSLFADPRVDSLTVDAAISSLQRPRQDIETTLDAMVQAGELVADEGPQRRYRVSPTEKHHLEAMFRDAAVELGEQGVLMRTTPEDALAPLEDETEEPRLPVTAGLLSLFLPGTGQLLNGDVGRASLVFAVWSLAWITHLSPVWTFVCLYAGAEAFFTAKIRSMERKLALEAGPPNKEPQPLKPA
jgi:hypothetical protein